MPLVIEIVLAPALAALATVATRRWGPRIGGLVSAFPAIVGPVLLIGALDHGRLFTARAANGTLLGLVALSAFALAYGHSALRRGWRASLLAGWLCAVASATFVGLLRHGAGSPVGLLVAVISIGVAYRWMPRTAIAPPRTAAGRESIPARMGLTALLVSLLATAAGALGPAIGGMLAALPVLASVLAVFTHRDRGPGAVTALLRGMLVGMAGFVAFCQVLLVLIVEHGTLTAFAAATAAALFVQAATVCVGPLVAGLTSGHRRLQ